MKINLFFGPHSFSKSNFVYDEQEKMLSKTKKKSCENTKILPKYKREYTIHVLQFRVQNDACFNILST